MEGLDFLTSSVISMTEGRVKLEKVVPEYEGGAQMSTPETAPPHDARCWWMLLILDVKNDMSELEKSVDWRW